MVDPTLLMLPVVVPVFWIARRLDLIASTPLWIVCGLLVAAFQAACLTTALWGEDHDGWRLWARVGIQIFGITAVMYAIGWGPMLAIGLVFGAVESIRLSGSRAVLPSIVLSVAALSIGELAIALGIVPTLVEQPLVHGLAVLAALGVTFTIKQFERGQCRETVHEWLFDQGRRDPERDRELTEAQRDDAHHHRRRGRA